ncbi:MAG: cardiolipin synthase [Lachnospiraceae bacterium]|nr:cardiolipin synthase [Lachnospiraceae bacterium]
MKKIKKFLLGRATIVALAILLQLLWILSFLQGFRMRYSFLNSIIDIIAIFVVLVIVNKKSNPSYKIAWMVVILVIPIVGLLVYFIFGRSELTRPTRKRMEAINSEMELKLPDNADVLANIREEDKAVYRQAKYIRDWAKFPIYQNTATKYYKTGEEMFPDILKALEEAQHFIFMEFFIVEEGYMFGKILEILKRKAAQGVDVRFIYDDFGCVTTLPAKYYQNMQEWGIQCVRFNPLYPVMSVIMNNRDHRKILVSDGKVGFTGGINLADEYINKVERFGYWKDAGLRLEGEGVWSFTIMFLEMWDYINRSSETDFARFSPGCYQEKPFANDGYVQPYADSPLDSETTGENIYMNMIAKAKDYVYVFTPYLILDNEMIRTLQNAAKSGVDVRIIMPGIPDKKVVYWMSQSYYEPLIECGVRIYQYKPGFLHAKCFVSDDSLATVGSINMDYRSLYLHFECGVFMYKTAAVLDVKKDMLQTMEEAEEINMEFCQKRPAAIRTFLGVVRLFAPLL